MIRALPLLAVAASSSVPVGVEDLRLHHGDHLGQRVQVRGWLLRACYDLECGLYQSRAGGDSKVSIGDAPEFDRVANRAIGREIVVEATVTAHCWPSDGVRCLDRGDQLADPRLLRVLPSD